jgi:hypothetical protein
VYICKENYPVYITLSSLQYARGVVRHREMAEGLPFSGWNNFMSTWSITWDQLPGAWLNPKGVTLQSRQGRRVRVLGCMSCACPAAKAVFCALTGRWTFIKHRLHTYIQYTLDLINALVICLLTCLASATLPNVHLRWIPNSLLWPMLYGNWAHLNSQYFIKFRISL